MTKIGVPDADGLGESEAAVWQLVEGRAEAAVVEVTADEAVKDVAVAATKLDA